MNQQKQKQNNIYILGIETSCDETAASVILNGRKVLSNIISSQINIHKKFGGVVPEIASRNHIKVIAQVIDEALDIANIKIEDIDGIAVTYAPGLEGALLVGLNYAKSLAYAYDIRLIGVNHLEGHIYANFLENEELKPPFLTLIVSGGHTNLVHVKDYGDYTILGSTKDDAIGEAYDKIARVLGLEYPGGPKIDKLAKSGNENAIDFPIVMLDKNSLDFSYSGLKSAVLNYINSCKMKNIDFKPEDVAASFQKAAISVLLKKSHLALSELDLDTLVLAGGVSANSYLRNEMEKMGNENNFKVVYPEPIFCTDNGAMIGSCGYYKYLMGKFDDIDLNGKANLKLGEDY